MDPKTVFRKTSKGALEPAGKSRLLGREPARILARVEGRLSHPRFERISTALTAEGFVRPLPAGQHTVLAGELGFSSTIIVDEANTQAFLEARAQIGRLARQEA